MWVRFTLCQQSIRYQCCGTGTAGNVTFCCNGNGTVIYYGSGTVLTCTCRGVPIAPSRRMLETLFLDEDSLLLTWSISTVFRVFNAVLCIFMGCCSSDFFLCIRLFPLVFQQSFELLDIFCLSGFSGQLVPWLCHSHTETVSSHLCPCILVDQV